MDEQGQQGESVEPIESVGQGTDEAVAAPASVSRRGAVAALGAIVVVLAVFFVVAFAPKGAPADGMLPGDPTGYAMPDITAQLLDGSGEFSLASLKGQPLVVNFWQSSCAPCRDEAAFLAAAEKAWRSKGVVFIGIDTKDDQTAARAFEDEYGIEYRSLVDQTGRNMPLWGVTGYPETFFIGRDGRIVSKFISNIDAATLDARIAEIAAS